MALVVGFANQRSTGLSQDEGVGMKSPGPSHDSGGSAYLFLPRAGHSVTMKRSSRTGIRTLPRIPS